MSFLSIVSKIPRKCYGWTAVIVLLFANITVGVRAVALNQELVALRSTIPVPTQAEVENRKLIVQIEHYLDHISPEFTQKIQSLAEQYHLSSWGCGPSSYALAQILNKKFFQGNVAIQSTYENEPRVIVERFGLAGVRLVDHAWLEIHLGDQFLFIDPTIGQFGHENKIAYQVFHEGDPRTAFELSQRYGIHTVRLPVLLHKAIKGISISEEPYPDFAIAKNNIAYFLKAMQDWDDVDVGVVPAEWKIWVDTLTKSYS